MATKSKLILEFITVPTVGYDLTVNMDTGNGTIPLNMDAVAQRVASEQYTANGSSVQTNVDNFVYAWNIDHRNVGGFDNLKAIPTTHNGNPAVSITLQNESWQFGTISGLAITSDQIQPDITNEEVKTLFGFTETLDDADCDDADYSLNIVGGSPPFSITGINTPVTTSSRTPTIQLTRGFARTVRITDDNGLEISKQIVPPVKLESSQFKITVVQDSGAKATVEPNVVFKSDILPLEYSLNGTDYQGSGVFPGLDFETTYTAYIRDTFGCVVTKLFVTPNEVTGADETATLEYQRFFEYSNANALIMSKLEGDATNFTNSMSFEELVGVPYETETIFFKDWTIVEQFKSGYSYHKITLLENGVARYIEPVLQVQNLNLLEKVDCKLFRDDFGALGVYFRNGNTYQPNTTTTNGNSDYDATNLPSWARAGNTVNIDTIGNVKIKRITTDADRGLYLQMNTPYTSTTDDDGKIQANYNEQPYNTYEYSFPMSYVESCARVFVEMGFVVDGTPMVELTYGSEIVKKTDSKKGYLHLAWSDTHNKADIVYQTGVVQQLLMPFVKWVGNTESTSELYDSDDETVSLDQEVGNVWQMVLKARGFKLQEKLQLGSSMENFFVNGLNYKKREMTSSSLGNSNLYKMEGAFKLGGNQLTIQPQEIVLNPPLTPSTEKPQAPLVIPSALAVDSEGLVYNGDGGFILVSDGT